MLVINWQGAKGDAVPAISVIDQDELAGVGPNNFEIVPIWPKTRCDKIFGFAFRTGHTLEFVDDFSLAKIHDVILDVLRNVNHSLKNLLAPLL